MHFIKLGLIILSFGAASETLNNPTIQYCFHGSKSLFSSRECTLTQISNSTFQFGKTDQNVLTIPTRSRPRYLLMKCSAPYPIRWLAVKPLRDVSLLSNPDTNRFSHNPLSTDMFQYSQEVTVNLGTKFSRILLCEGFNVTTRSANVYVNHVIRDIPELSIDTEGGDYFLGAENGGATANTLLPCLADAFNGNFDVQAVRTHFKNGTLNTIREDCVECICRASSDCSSFPCQSTNVCGELHEEYWMGEKAKAITDTVQCRRDSLCAKRVLYEYLTNSRSKLVDCNGDKLVTCEDAARFHMNAKNQNCSEHQLSNVFAECLYEKKENFTLLRTQPADYDPRIGMRIHEPIDFDSKYECVSRTIIGSATNGLLPLNSGKQLQVELSLEKETGEINCILTEARSYSYQTPNVLVGKCKSLTECELKFKPLFPDVFLTGKSSLLGQFEAIGPTAEGFAVGHFTSYNQGYLHCTANYRRTGEFVSHIDYFFTGLDNKKYIYSEPHPENSKITIKSQKTVNLTSGRMYNFSCQISTFVLLPNIQFIVGYSNGELKHVKYGEPTDGARILMSNIDLGKATLTWSLELIASTSLNKVTCYAPQITSENWARAELRLTVVESIDTAPTSTDGNNAIAYYVLGSLMALVVLVVFVTRRRKAIPYVQSCDMRIFVSHKKESEGVLSATSNVDPICPSLSGWTDKQISGEYLKIADEDIIGEGEFGTVRQGTLHEQKVAVKSCKSDVDAEYFRTFLKELKTLTFVGEHPNIVKFYGAVVKNIHKRECLAVFELSSTGNLNLYLRNEAKTLQKGMINRSILVSFCRQVANGMEFLYIKEVIHGDLASRNVLVFENNVVKLTDFGLARRLYNYSNYTKKKTVALPWRWMALESLRYVEFSAKTDVWSFGVTAWEIFSLAKVPFPCHSFSDEFIEKLESGYRLLKPDLASDVVYEMMKSCWQNTAEDRPTFSELKQLLVNIEQDAHVSDGIYGIVKPIEDSSKGQ